MKVDNKSMFKTRLGLLLGTLILINLCFTLKYFPITHLLLFYLVSYGLPLIVLFYPVYLIFQIKNTQKKLNNLKG
jgi:ABC-type glycerol-3-phosphate transport system permease component